jgi:ribosomal-protein-alanine N-acetyltransferase
MLVALAKTPQTVDRPEIAGYIAARATERELHINNVAVRDSYRYRGIGYMLLSRAIEQGKRMGVNSAFLEVRSGNSAAQALYKKCGFKAIARRPNYYSDPLEDAIVMNLIL